MNRKNTRGWLSALALVLTTGGAAMASPPDFNGDGRADAVIGAPGEDIGAIADAGAVHVIYGGPGGLNPAGNVLIHQNAGGVPDACEPGDRFGAATAWGDLDGDGFSDLIVSVPGEGIGAAGRAGAVHIFYGSPAGLTAAGTQFLHQDSPGVWDTAEIGDAFGQSVASGDFNGDGRDDLAIGVPGEDIGGAGDAGAAHIFYGTPVGLGLVGNQFWNQDSWDLADTCEPGDRFGFSLAVGDFDGNGFDNLAIGSPGERIGALVNAGAVHVLYANAGGLQGFWSQLWHQDIAGIPDAAEAGDQFGYALTAGDYDNNGFDNLAIGVPGEDVGAIVDAGFVQVLYANAGGLQNFWSQIWSQDTPGIQDLCEPSDFFGMTLETGYLNGDPIPDLVIGVPRENVGAIVDAGVTQVIFGSGGGLTAAGNQLAHQDIAGVQDFCEVGDGFGTRLLVGDFNGDGRQDLLTTAAGEDVGAIFNAGAAHVFFGTPAGLTAIGNQLLHQDSPGIQDLCEPGDGFGG